LTITVSDEDIEDLVRIERSKRDIQDYVGWWEEHGGHNGFPIECGRFPLYVKGKFGAWGERATATAEEWEEAARFIRWADAKCKRGEYPDKFRCECPACHHGGWLREFLPGRLYEPHMRCPGCGVEEIEPVFILD